MLNRIFLLVLCISCRIREADGVTATPSLSPTTLETYVYEEIASETRVREQENTYVMSLIANETSARKKALLVLEAALDHQEKNSAWFVTNITQELLALKIRMLEEASQREIAYTLFIHNLQQQTEQCIDEYDALQEAIYLIGNLTHQWNTQLNSSLQQHINNSDDALYQLTQDINFLSINTHEYFVALLQQLNQDIRITNTTLHNYVFTAWSLLKQDVESMSSTLTEKINRDVQAIKAKIDSFTPNSANDTRAYLIPEAFVTNIITHQAAAIAALDDPRIQEARRMFDLALSCKEFILICIALFNVLILVTGMTVVQSIHYRFRLTDKAKLDRLRRGIAGPVGSDFDRFIGSLETIIVQSNFTTTERLERLVQLAEVSQLKNDSLSLFSSLRSLRELRRDLKKNQELCALGLLRERDPSRQALGGHVYSCYIPWRRVNYIRSLIYTVLRSYAGRVQQDDDYVLGRKEQWKSRNADRKEITDCWRVFKTRLPSTYHTKAVEILLPEALMLSMKVEYDEKTSPDFSRYLHRFHAMLCLISDVPSLIEDLYCDLEKTAYKDVDTAIQSIHAHHPYLSIDLLSNSMEHSQTLLTDTNGLMDELYRLTRPRPYWDIRQYVTRARKTEEIQRAIIIDRLYETFRALVHLIEESIPLFVTWMDHYPSIAAHVDTALQAHLELVSDQIHQTNEEAHHYKHKYKDIIHTLSTEPGLPGLVDLIDISYYLGLKLDQSHTSQRRSVRRISPLSQGGLFNEIPLEKKDNIPPSILRGNHG